MVNESLIEGLTCFSPDYDQEGEIEPHFRKGGCDTCNTRLGGNYYDVNCWYKNKLDNTEEIITITVCSDCFVELCG